VSKLTKRARHRNRCAKHLPLLDHIDRVRIRDLPLPARRLVQRYGFSASTALAVALAAGFNCEAER
jgi:hypothetical protein